MCYLILPSFIYNNSLKLIKIGYRVIVPKLNLPLILSARRKYYGIIICKIM